MRSSASTVVVRSESEREWAGAGIAIAAVLVVEAPYRAPFLRGEPGFGVGLLLSLVSLGGEIAHFSDLEAVMPLVERCATNSTQGACAGIAGFDISKLLGTAFREMLGGLSEAGHITRLVVGLGVASAFAIFRSSLSGVRVESVGELLQAVAVGDMLVVVCSRVTWLLPDSWRTISAVLSAAVAVAGVEAVNRSLIRGGYQSLEGSAAATPTARVS